MPRKPPDRKRAARSVPPPGEISNTAPPSADIQTGDFSLHTLFQQQAIKLLDRADLSEEEKQNVLVAMSCPCCGVGGLSYTVKLKRRK
jgi:hypothetical protein